MDVARLKEFARPIYAPLAQTGIGRKIVTSGWRFDRLMSKYFSDHCTTVPPTSDDPNFRNLVQNGFVVLPDYHAASVIKPVHDCALDMMERIKRGRSPADWRTYDYSEDGIYRLLDADRHVPGIAPILKDRYVLSLVEAYYRPKAFGEKLNYFDYKPDLVHDYTSMLHMDSPFSQLKIFTLLCDVGPHNAPLAFWAKSHLNAAWRRRFDYMYWTGDEVGISGIVPANIMRQLRAAGGDQAPEEVVVTGPAGTVVIADTRGIHRASNLVKGYRLELVQKFGH
jgi:phytanoyl-CoA dioxygenase PhyH